MVGDEQSQSPRHPSVRRARVRALRPRHEPVRRDARGGGGGALSSSISRPELDSERAGLHNGCGVELVIFLPLIAFKAVVMGVILWWALRRSGDEEGDDGEGGLRVDVAVDPRPPWRWTPRRRSP